MARQELWGGMRRVACNFSSLPWAILGDFNVSRSVQEQLGGKPGLSKAMLEFKACIRDCEIEDIRQTGCFYTWNNKRSGRELITKKLDRVMGNWLWFQQVVHLQAHFHAPGISDHSPAELHLRFHPPGLGRAFKFLNIWVSHPSFLGIFRQVWAAEVSGTPLEVVAKKLKLLKPALQRLHSDHFKNPTSLVS
ncbi:Exo_endo_phos domain-containing protein [Cephalotus follicularis]|uniref:Exo_endo_phos domain-containing protein n=1 Tax=Cephalotus follicularis TaxID=3775 RepID=A0A1Q3CAW6_CEPFO|nr:Exo_endo_phos domain-containing protein [Cephalotus follicularis]